MFAGYESDVKALKNYMENLQVNTPLPSLHLHKGLTLKERLGLLSADITVLVLSNKFHLLIPPVLL